MKNYSELTSEHTPQRENTRHGSLDPFRRVRALRVLARLGGAPEPPRRYRAEDLAPREGPGWRVRSEEWRIHHERRVARHPPVRRRVEDPQQRQVHRRVHRDRGEDLRHRARRGSGGRRRLRRAPQGPMGRQACVLQAVLL